MTDLVTRPEPPAAAPLDLFPAVTAPELLDDHPAAWRSSVCRAGAYLFTVTVDRADLVDLVLPVTTPLHAPCEGPGTGSYHLVSRTHEHLPYALYHEGRRLAVAATPARLLRFLTTHVNRTMIERTSRGHVVLHAAAARRAGITVVLPGDQERGKTTTVAGLLREGFDYITDEAVALEPRTLRVLPFPKALSIDEGAWPLFPECRPASAPPEVAQWQVPSEHLGSRAVRGSAERPAIVVLPEYRPRATTRLTPVRPGDAVRALAQCTFHFPLLPGRNLRVLGDLVAGATVAHLLIGDLGEAVAAVEGLVSDVLLGRLTA